MRSPGLGQQLDDPRLRLVDRATGQLAVGLGGPGRDRRDSQPVEPHSTDSRRPSRPTMVRVGRFSSRHHTTSVVSPKVQIMAMPDPFSGSASWWASTGTSTPNSGVVHLGAEQRDGSARRRGGPPGPRRPAAARAGSSRSRPRPRRRRGGTEPVVGPGPLAVLQLGLGHRRLEVDVPQGGRRRAGTTSPRGQVAQEHCAGRPAGSGRRWWRRCASSPPTGRACATGARRPARPPR